MGNKIKEKLLLFRLRAKKSSDAFGELYDLYNDRIYRFILFKVSNKEETQDLASETFLRTWQHINQDKPVTNLNALLYSIARNLIIDYYRKQARYDSAPPEVLEIIPGTDAEKIIKGIDIKGDVKKISEALVKMNEQYSEVLVLRFIEGLSSIETAEIMGCTKGNVRVLQHRALIALRKQLKEV